jgi:hypothetical protein
MPFDFEYSVQVQKYDNGFKLHYIIPNKYFEGKSEEFQTFLNKILDKKDENDFIPYKDLFEGKNINEIVDELMKMKCVKLTPESYLLSVKHHIIQEFKQFNKIYYRIKSFSKNLNEHDMYSQITKKYMLDNAKSCLDELIKTYKSDLEHDFKGFVNFNEYSEENKNLNKLHTDILLALNNHEKEYEGVCFEITNLLNENSNENENENVIYYRLANRISTRIMKQERKEKYEKRGRSEKREKVERRDRNERKEKPEFKKWKGNTNKFRNQNRKMKK